MSKRRADPSVQQQLEKHAEAREIKRRKTALSTDAPTKSKQKKTQLEALKAVMCEGTKVVTHTHTHCKHLPTITADCCTHL
jgi:hypothetical protein